MPPGHAPGGVRWVDYPLPPMNDPGRPAPAAPTLEPTALAAFLVALLLGWCPLTGLAAIALGITALLRIRERGGARTGRGLALGGIGIAAALLTGWGVLLDRLGTEVWDSMDTQAMAAIDAGLDRPGAGPVAWDAEGAPADDEAKAFASRLREALGPVREVAITNRAVEGLTARTVTVAFTATGERGVGFGSAAFTTDPRTVPPVLLLRRIEMDIAGKRIRLPADGGETQ